VFCEAVNEFSELPIETTFQATTVAYVGAHKAVKPSLRGAD
jgi:hypothetical protein